MNLKETVYKISSHPALGPVGKSLYFLCERLLTHTFKGFPEIRSAYVAGSMAEGDIVPGLSDIDCVITIDDLDAREEYGLMTGLERKTRYRMPPFGKDKIGVHVVAYSSAEWALLGDLFLGKKAGRPRVLFRDREIAPDNTISDRVKILHHLYKAYWKIINLQDSTLNPSGSPLERELTKRIAERTMTALDNAMKEAGSGNVPRGYSGLGDRARESWELLKRSDDESKYIEMLAILLHLFDVAAGAVCQRGTNADGDSSGEASAAGEIPAPPAGITDVVAAIRQRRKDSAAVVYTNADKADIFLFDPADNGLTAAIVEHYKRIGDSGLRVMSIDKFRQFFLNFSDRAAVDLLSGEPLALVGARDPEALLLDAYSILPQLRSPRTWQSAEMYESFRGKAGRIIRELKTSAPGGGASYDGPNEGRGIPRDEYERFVNLKVLSQTLTETLREFLSPRQESHD